MCVSLYVLVSVKEMVTFIDWQQPQKHSAYMALGASRSGSWVILSTSDLYNLAKNDPAYLYFIHQFTHLVSDNKNNNCSFFHNNGDFFT